MCPILFFKILYHLNNTIIKMYKKKSVHWEQTLYKQINLIQN